MHELSIIAGLFEILEEKAREQKATKVVLVKLQVGKLAGVVPEFLETAFNTYKEGTLAAEALLEIEDIPPTIKCQKCGTEFTSENFVFLCPSCGSAEIKILAGTELLLEKIELEV